MRVWYRTLAIIRRIWSASPETSVALSPQNTRLPLEIVEMIITHLIYDTRSLRACSLTCYSWYITAVPHLHHTLITRTYPPNSTKKPIWPRPLRTMHKLGLLPLVKKLQIHGKGVHRSGEFSSQHLNCFTMRYFSALTNIQELGIQYLDIPSFMPKIRRYFKHFLPTVRSLALREPIGTHRQVIYFIGLFRHLDDLKLLYDRANSQGEPADDHTLTPPFIPPLRGQLTMTHLTTSVLLEDMIKLFGGLGFHYMDLFDVDGMRLLLGTCAKTLETLRLYPGPDPRGKQLSLNSLPRFADSLQLGPRFRTLIYHRTSRCGHSRSWRGILLTHVS